MIIAATGEQGYEFEVPAVAEEYGSSSAEITSITYNCAADRLIVHVTDPEVPDGWYEYSFVGVFNPDTEEILIKDGSAVGATDVEGNESIIETTVVDVVQAIDGVSFDV